MTATGGPIGGRGVPLQANRHFGRLREQDELRRLLVTHRTATVVGPPGVGKTRLAAEVAADLADDLPDGAVFVELAGLREPGLLANTVAGALGLRGQAGAEGQTVVGHLRGRHLLLVLDNCEHLVDACCELACAVLHACPDVIVLATSRQSLGVAGERLFPLLPFDVPAPDAVRSPADLAPYDAVSLFLDRAQAVVPTFDVREDNCRDVARVVRELDGLPLAIELAAVRLRSLSVQQLADRLTDKLALLTRPLLRRRSLHATLDWSHDLCTPDEQRVWAAASVFAGSFDLAAAEHVCEADPDAMLEVVAGLVDKSVLIARECDGENRYHMLETLREYGQERLGDAEAARLGKRHRDYFAELAARLQAAPGRPEQARLCRSLRPDHANVRKALEYCATTPGEADTGLKMAVDLTEYWNFRRMQAEPRTWQDRLLPLASPESPDRVRALLHNAGHALNDGDRPRCAERLAEATASGACARDESLRQLADVVTGMWAAYDGDTARGLRIFSELVEQHSKAGNRPMELFSRFFRGWCAAFSGDEDTARAAFDEGLARSVEWGDRHHRKYMLVGLTIVEAEFGDAQAAARRFDDVLAAARDAGDDELDGDAVAVAGWVAGRLDNHVRAATLYGIAEAVGRIEGFTITAAVPLFAAHTRHVRRTREALGDTAFDKHLSAGAMLPPADAFRYVFDTSTTTTPAPAATGVLTRRERQIAGLVRQGLSNRQIGSRLVISRRTAETHIANIMAKLGFTSRSQIAVWASEHS